MDAATINRDVRTLPHLERYSVTNLFGRRPFSFSVAEEGPTLLTGSNGSGKSTVLRTIHGTLSGDWLGVTALPFGELVLSFSDGSELTVENHRAEGLRVGLDGNTW